MAALLDEEAAGMAAPAQDATVDLGALYAESNIAEILAQLDRDLVGLVPVKTRIREIAALLLVESARRGLGIQAEPPSLHMCFTGAWPTCCTA
jgi:hypothetical protein